MYQRRVSTTEANDNARAVRVWNGLYAYATQLQDEGRMALHTHDARGIILDDDASVPGIGDPQPIDTGAEPTLRYKGENGPVKSS